MVDAQMESLEAQDHYDALSADVIRPAFRYHNHHGDQRSTSLLSKARPSMSLGSAAISSVTSTLSPILPFTGGLDLRREDYWTKGWFGSFHSVLEQVRDAFEVSYTDTYSRSTLNDGEKKGQQNENENDSSRVFLEIPRGGAAVAGRTRNKKPKPCSSTKRDFILSNTNSFVPLKDIAELTLKDVTMSFRYAVESTRKDFNSGKFLSELLPRVKSLMHRMSTATNIARGKGVLVPVTEEVRGQPPIAPTGNIDALNFCAAMRIFAEWRVLRQVPPGYKGYAVGIGLGQKDIVQNIAKIENAIHDYIDHRIKTNNKGYITSSGTDGRDIFSPTLRDLLQYEVDTDVHDNTKLPRLKEKSAAMGLLWVRRQLVYQTAIFKNVMDVPGRFDSTRTAVQGAYDEVYGSLHGWAVQKIFSYSFQAAPDGIEIYKYMNPHRLQEVQNVAKSKFMRVTKQRRELRNPLNELKSNNPLERFSRHVGKEWDKVTIFFVNEWDKFSGNVLNEWDKVSGNIGQMLEQQQHQGQQLQSQRQQLTPSDSTNSDQIMNDLETMVTRELEMEDYINQEMRNDAYEHIRAYLEVANPLLDDLTSLFDEFNMDDPTKV